MCKFSRHQQHQHQQEEGREGGNERKKQQQQQQQQQLVTSSRPSSRASSTNTFLRHPPVSSLPPSSSLSTFPSSSSKHLVFPPALRLAAATSLGLDLDDPSVAATLHALLLSLPHSEEGRQGGRVKKGLFVKRTGGGGREGGMGRRVFVVLVSFLCLMAGLWVGVEMEYVDRSFFTIPSTSPLVMIEVSGGGGQGGGRGRRE